MDSEPDEETRDSSGNVNVIQVQFEDNNYDISVQSPQPENSNVIRGKYYKQTYRTAWESMPDFKGWLRGVQGEPTRAYCLYCQKTLHAHRLSLLKHTCTIRHQKAAQIHTIRKSKEQMSNAKGVIIARGELENHQEGESDDMEAGIEYGEIEEQDYEEQEQEEVDDEDPLSLETLPVQFKKQIRQQIISPMAASKPPISTHVLDTTKGVPVNGLQVSLYKLIEGRWTYINEACTNIDGRCTGFLERNDFTPGRYKLHYDVDRFFEAKKQDTLYPFIEIVFDCRSSHDHYHVPLLLSPYGYTTYRGS